MFFLNDEQKLVLTVVGRTAGGKVKPVPDPVTWSFDNPAAGAVFPPQGQTTEFVSADDLAAPQAGTVTVRAAGLTATEVITVDPAPVVSLSIEAPAPAPK